MIDYNKVILAGHLLFDPVLKTDKLGATYLANKIENRRSWTDRNGERKTETNRIAFICWGDVARIASNKLKAGAALMVEGKLKVEQWHDPDKDEMLSELLIHATLVLPVRV